MFSQREKKTFLANKMLSKIFEKYFLNLIILDKVKFYSFKFNIFVKRPNKV